MTVQDLRELLDALPGDTTLRLVDVDVTWHRRSRADKQMRGEIFSARVEFDRVVLACGVWDDDVY